MPILFGVERMMMPCAAGRRVREPLIIVFAGQILGVSVTRIACRSVGRFIEPPSSNSAQDLSRGSQDFGSCLCWESLRILFWIPGAKGTQPGSASGVGFQSPSPKRMERGSEETYYQRDSIATKPKSTYCPPAV